MEAWWFRDAKSALYAGSQTVSVRIIKDEDCQVRNPPDVDFDSCLAGRMNNSAASHADLFHSLHHGQKPLLLSNVWDAASARIADAAGIPAVATTSAGIAWAAGMPDGDRLSRSQAVEAINSIVCATTAPVTADVEGGYTDTTYGIAETVKAFLAAGVVGLNIEDGARRPDELVKKIEVARGVADDCGIRLFINARTDVFLTGSGTEAELVFEATTRAARYLEAGADGIFVPGASDAGTISELVGRTGGPLNVMAGPGALSVRELSALGVARVSLGSAVAQAAYAVVRNATNELVTHGTYSQLTESLDYGALNTLISGAYSGPLRS